ncbi:PEP-CTERM sorting domain-containing protein [Paludibacterium yongneupense]|uniref:PEP-CTERM sorting domain-containing protein n=1 Tax=Paludibacterium yongneupense TaxID=400061 RepID=UPI0004000C14|nr:PEP-CTERM sorting domain-containing protein [Paludibacterium yongneupense]
MRLNSISFHASRILLTLLLALPLLAGAATRTLNFDDVVLQPTWGQSLASDYAGFNWSAGFSVLNPTGYMPGSPPLAGRISGDNVAILGNGGSGSFAATNGTFDLLGAWMTATNFPNLTVEVQAKHAGIVLYDQIVSLSTTVPERVAFNFYGIDSVSFLSHDSLNGIVFDDIQVVTPVPEPEGYALLGAGLLGLLLRRRRRQILH